MTGIKTHCTVCNRPTPEQPSWAHVQSWMWRNGWKGENRRKDAMSARRAQAIEALR